MTFLLTPALPGSFHFCALPEDRGKPVQKNWALVVEAARGLSVRASRCIFGVHGAEGGRSRERHDLDDRGAKAVLGALLRRQWHAAFRQGGT